MTVLLKFRQVITKVCTLPPTAAATPATTDAPPVNGAAARDNSAAPPTQEKIIFHSIKKQVKAKNLLVPYP